MSLLWSLEVFLRLVLQVFRAYGAESRPIYDFDGVTFSVSASGLFVIV